MQTYRARSSALWGWLAIAIGVVVAVVHVANVGFGYAHGGLGLGAALALFGWAAFLRPHVAAGEGRVEFHNVTQVATVPFARLSDLGTRWSLEAVGDDGRTVGAFAAPAPGAAASKRHERAAEGGSIDKAEYARAGDVPGTPSGDAAALVHDAWDEWRAAGGEAGGEGASITRTPDWIGLVAVVAGTALAIWGLLF
ncbi:hypothetical protein [Demequina rhizosphaerae]|uniref:hypothetical protein n=1 Tax=Demequina rhizosphaerae TaxID=1638985 RepID=UPI0007842AB6|nr:hypothetical protein [Demequina rhizosphaerae]